MDAETPRDSALLDLEKAEGGEKSPVIPGAVEEESARPTATASSVEKSAKEEDEDSNLVFWDRPERSSEPDELDGEAKVASDRPPVCVDNRHVSTLWLSSHP